MRARRRFKVYTDLRRTGVHEFGVLLAHYGHDYGERPLLLLTLAFWRAHIEVYLYL